VVALLRGNRLSKEGGRGCLPPGPIFIGAGVLPRSFSKFLAGIITPSLPKLTGASAAVTAEIGVAEHIVRLTRQQLKDAGSNARS
jgi:hypothetical protein